MGTTGLIYAAIVAVWAAYLVPLWLRRHDEESASRSAERFTSAMRVLARRQQSTVAGGATAGNLGAGSTGSRVGGPGDYDLEPIEFADPGPTPATRRRRVLVALLAVSTVFAGLAAVAVVPWWSWFVSLAVAAAFLGLSAWIAAGERAVADDRRSQPYPGYAAGYAHAAYGGDAAYGAYAGDSAAVYGTAMGYGMADGYAPEHSIDFGAPVPSGEVAVSGGVPGDAAAGGSATGGEMAAGTGAEAEDPESVYAVLPDDFANSSHQQREDGTWDPREVPLPTYVTKEAAPRAGRRIEIGDAPEHRRLLDETGLETTGIRDELYDREQTGDFDDLRAAE